MTPQDKATIIILLSIAAAAIFPSLLLWTKHIIAFIQRRRRMYKAYLQRLDDFEQYYKFMERCEREYQKKRLLHIQEQATRMWRELIK
jgi:hypothetical protein